jgi:hypothetical protein
MSVRRSPDVLLAMSNFLLGESKSSKRNDRKEV